MTVLKDHAFISPIGGDIVPHNNFQFCTSGEEISGLFLGCRSRFCSCISAVGQDL